MLKKVCKQDDEDSEGSIKSPIPKSLLLYTLQWCEKDVGMDEAFYTTVMFISSLLCLHTFLIRHPYFF